MWHLKSVVYVLALAATAMLAFLVWHEPRTDAGKDWLQAYAAVHGGDPYDLPDQHADTYGFEDWVRRPDAASNVVPPRTPGALALTAPFLVFQLESVPELVLLANSLAVVTCLALVGQVAGRWWLPATAPLFVLFAPFQSAVGSGNPGPVIMAFLVAGWWFARRNQDVAAGAMLAVATTMRLWPGLFVAVLFLSGRRRVGWWAAGGFAAFNTVGATALEGWSFDGMMGAFSATSTGMMDLTWNGSVAALTGSLAIGYAATAVGGLACLIWAYRARPSVDRLYAISVPVALLVSPISWPMYHLALLPALSWPTVLVVLAAWIPAILTPIAGPLMALGAGTVLASHLLSGDPMDRTAPVRQSGPDPAKV